MKLNVTLTTSTAHFDINYKPPLTVESVNIAYPLVDVLLSVFVALCWSFRYYLRLYAIPAAIHRILLTTPFGRAIQASLVPILKAVLARFDAVTAPIQARLVPLRAKINAVLAPCRTTWDFAVAYFRRMAHLLTLRILGTLPPQALPGLEEDIMLSLIFVVVSTVFWTWLLMGPVALSVLLTRKLIWAFGWALLSLQPKRLQATTTPFRFLDLPAELRNRIYTYASDAALDIPMQIVYESAKHAKFDPERKKLHEMVVNLLNPFTIVWNTTSAHRLALLFANRQVRQEFSILHFDNMRMDFEFCDLRSSLPQMVQFIDTFRDRLRFVSKLEMPLGVAHQFLFDAASNEDLGCLGLSTETKAQLSAMRPFFMNVQQVIVYPDHKGITILEDVWDLANRQAVGFNILYQLAGSQPRQALKNTFPRLMDIVTRNQYGSERFRGLQDGSWRLWYSGVSIPTERAAWEDVMLAFRSVLIDPKTRLTGRLALNWVRA